MNVLVYLLSESLKKCIHFYGFWFVANRTSCNIETSCKVMRGWWVGLLTCCVRLSVRLSLFKHYFEMKLMHKFGGKTLTLMFLIENILFIKVP